MFNGSAVMTIKDIDRLVRYGKKQLIRPLPDYFTVAYTEQQWKNFRKMKLCRMTNKELAAANGNGFIKVGTFMGYSKVAMYLDRKVKLI
jgi:hypothetical protein